jgi:chromosome segregation ATPase
MRVQGEELHMVANENLGLAARLDKANVEISTLRFSVESARADAVVASSKNAQLINQLKGNLVECGALVKQFGEMREQLKELTEQKSQFSEHVAELQCHMSTVGRKREATVCPREATRVDVELFQSEAERLENERCELTVSRKHRHWLAAWRQPHNLVGSKASAYRWCRKSHDSACL